MQIWIENACVVAFVVLMIAPGVYGLHMYGLMLLAGRRRRDMCHNQQKIIADYARATSDDAWPTVTTQIPLYNEIHVASRVIRAVAAMDYPRGCHEIQVLDDSTDGTRAIVDRVCAELRAVGHDVSVVRRPDRAHFKAGALAYGMRQARGEFIAIFDADFVPAPGFLRRLIPLSASAEDICCVQARWEHLNRSESWITEALSLGMDGHFGVEQPARGWNGLLLNFNGTAGIWRRAAIEDPAVGGWSGDTITEDLDLSYRAQLAGWRIVYCQDEPAPAEIPADVQALKSQQRRWATGSMQTARKLLPAVWRARLTLLQKLEASFHLTQYSVNVFMVLMALIGRPLLWLVPPARYAPLLEAAWVLILAAAVAPSIAYIYGRWSVGGRIPGPIRIVQLVALGFGLSLNNAAAVVAGLRQHGGEFVRTPKSGATDGRRPRESSYVLNRSNLWLGELALGAYSLFQWAFFLRVDHYLGGTFLLLFGVGMGMIGWKSRPRRVPEASTANEPPFPAAEGGEPALAGAAPSSAR